MVFQPLKLFVQKDKEHGMVTVAIAINEPEARKSMRMYGLYYNERAAVESYDISRDKVYNFMCGEIPKHNGDR